MVNNNRCIKPAFEAMMRRGSSKALRTINAPSFSSPSSLSVSITPWHEVTQRHHRQQCLLQQPRVLHVKHHLYDLFSLSFQSQLRADTDNCDTAGKFSKAFLKFFFVIIRVVFSICILICATRPLIASWLPRPSMIVVLSFVIMTRLALPRS